MRLAHWACGNGLAVLGLALAACGGNAATATALPTEARSLVATPSAAGSPPRSPLLAPATPSPSPAPTSPPELADIVEVADVRVHLVELQRIADTNGGTRATGKSGFDASVEYVAARLAAAGYAVERQPFDVGGVASVNLIVERGGRAPEVVMVGAHLDSVLAGPGINDNGSGVATLLVLAERLAEISAPGRTIRIAFWGAEENGPFGSRAYVRTLAEPERARIGAYLNLDMLGSDNFVHFVYADTGAAAGSDEITALFGTHFESRGRAWVPIDLTGDSDHLAFAEVGIRTGGLFSGGIEPKTDAEADAFGGTAGLPAYACTHAACDTIARISDASLDPMAEAIAAVLMTLATTDPGG